MKNNEAVAAAKAKPDTPCDMAGGQCRTEEKVSRCMVQFRPKDDWKGEFGFDWMRIGGDSGEKAKEDVYRDVITSINTIPYAGIETLKNLNIIIINNMLSPKAIAYDALKAEYLRIETEIKSVPEGLAEYFVPYLNLFPKGTGESPKPPFKAELKILVTVEEKAPDSIKFQYDKNIFTLSRDQLMDKAIGEKREASDGTLTITCNKAFDTDKHIDVFATFKGGESKLVGKLIVLKNSEKYVKKQKFVLVKVITNVDGQEKLGKILEPEKAHLHRSLHQCLVQGIVENGPSLDLSNDINFKIQNLSNGVKNYGHFIRARKISGKSTNMSDSGWDIDIEISNKEIFNYLRKIFLKDIENQKYKEDYFIIFFFGHICLIDRGIWGVTQNVGVKNSIIFEDFNGNSRPSGVMSHEALHGLGLDHTHHSPSYSTNKHFFFPYKTDNIMSYNIDMLISSWNWQWKIVNGNLNK